jgi:predicted nucleic acid-binding protein
MRDKIFIDTNIWVYAHLIKPGDIKHEAAMRVTSNPSGLVTGIQVVNEYYSVMLKNGAADELIQQNIETIFDNMEVCWFSDSLLRQAFSLRLRYHFSWWDSLVIAAAQSSGCKTLYTEDLQHDQQIGDLRVINPFLSTSA